MSECEQPFELENYVFKRCIGKGMYSSVFEVESNRYLMKFAAKMTEIDRSLLNPEGKLFDSEFAALMELDHPNIIKLYDHFVVKDLLILIFEYCPGGSLQEKLHKSGPMSQAEFAKFSEEIVSALITCHFHMIAHRDIKPSNIFLDEYGRAKLADFGLSVMARSGGKGIGLGRAGSLSYVAPEILESENYDPFKADIWSLGVTFYQLITGKLPWNETFQGMKPETLLQFPSEIDQELKDLLSWMLKGDPEQRPSAIEVGRHPFFARRKKKQNPLSRRRSGSDKKMYPPLLPSNFFGRDRKNGRGLSVSRSLSFGTSQSIQVEGRIPSCLTTHCMIVRPRIN